MQKQQSTYLFDFDGTLVDSMPTYIGIMLSILDKYGVKYENDIIKIITPLGYRGAAKYYRTIGVTVGEDDLTLEMRTAALNAYTYDIGEKPEVIKTLNKLKAEGASLNVLTASPHAALDPCLKRLGIFELFDNVWSCEDFETTKSDPEIYVMAAERIGVPKEEIIFVDDNINAVKTARLAGMISYGIYDPSSDDMTEEMKLASDRYIYSFDELLSEPDEKN